MPVLGLCALLTEEQQKGNAREPLQPCEVALFYPSLLVMRRCVFFWLYFRHDSLLFCFLYKVQSGLGLILGVTVT